MKFNLSNITILCFIYFLISCKTIFKGGIEKKCLEQNKLIKICPETKIILNKIERLGYSCNINNTPLDSLKDLGLLVSNGKLHGLGYIEIKECTSSDILKMQNLGLSLKFVQQSFYFAKIPFDQLHQLDTFQKIQKICVELPAKIR